MQMCTLGNRLLCFPCYLAEQKNVNTFMETQKNCKWDAVHIVSVDTLENGAFHSTWSLRHNKIGVGRQLCQKMNYQKQYKPYHFLTDSDTLYEIIPVNYELWSTRSVRLCLYLLRTFLFILLFRVGCKWPERIQEANKETVRPCPKSPNIVDTTRTTVNLVLVLLCCEHSYPCWAGVGHLTFNISPSHSAIKLKVCQR